MKRMQWDVTRSLNFSYQNKGVKMSKLYMQTKQNMQETGSEDNTFVLGVAGEGSSGSDCGMA